MDVVCCGLLYLACDAGCVNTVAKLNTRFSQDREVYVPCQNNDIASMFFSRGKFYTILGMVAGF